MKHDKRDPDDTGGVHGEPDELGLVEVFGQIARLECIQRTHGDQHEVQSERYEHGHMRLVAARQQGYVHVVDLRGFGHRVDNR